MKRSLFLLSLLALPILTAPAQAADLPSSIPLWEKGAPGFEARKDEPEKVETDGKGLFNVGSVH
ncbi:MAG: alpha/beta hydrolase, partial [Verrucomicrobiaceae bacterium]